MKVQKPLIPTWLYKMVASMEATICNCQCNQMQNCEGDCETILRKSLELYMDSVESGDWSVYNIGAGKRTDVSQAPANQNRPAPPMAASITSRSTPAPAGGWRFFQKACFKILSNCYPRTGFSNYDVLLQII